MKPTLLLAPAAARREAEVDAVITAQLAIIELLPEHGADINTRVADFLAAHGAAGSPEP